MDSNPPNAPATNGRPTMWAWLAAWLSPPVLFGRAKDTIRWVLAQLIRLRIENQHPEARAPDPPHPIVPIQIPVLVPVPPPDPPAPALAAPAPPPAPIAPAPPPDAHSDPNWQPSYSKVACHLFFFSLVGQIGATTVCITKEFRAFILATAKGSIDEIEWSIFGCAIFLSVLALIWNIKSFPQDHGHQDKLRDGFGIGGIFFMILDLFGGSSDHLHKIINNSIISGLVLITNILLVKYSYQQSSVYPLCPWNRYGSLPGHGYYMLPSKRQIDPDHEEEDEDLKNHEKDLLTGSNLKSTELYLREFFLRPYTTIMCIAWCINREIRGETTPLPWELHAGIVLTAIILTVFGRWLITSNPQWLPSLPHVCQRRCPIGIVGGPRQWNTYVATLNWLKSSALVYAFHSGMTALIFNYISPPEALTKNISVIYAFMSCLIAFPSFLETAYDIKKTNKDIENNERIINYVVKTLYDLSCRTYRSSSSGCSSITSMFKGIFRRSGSPPHAAHEPLLNLAPPV